MNSLSISRCALSVCVAAVLFAGCGGSQAPVTTVPVTATSRTTHSGPTLNYQVLHSFGSGSDGGNPSAGLAAVNGKLYGTTESGGGTGCSGGGCGTVFAITKDGKENVLHSFGSGSDGATPSAGLVNEQGTLYGTTSTGGAYGGGTVFSITTGGTEKVLHSFGLGSDGAGPSAGGLVNAQDTLYGTTDGGGAHGFGTVYSISLTTGTETVLYSFRAGRYGWYPYAGLLKVNGKLYGTTTYGGANGTGIVYRIRKTGTETLLHSFGTFGAGPDGTFPYAGLVNVNGTLYGTTVTGGTACGGSYGCGTVYRISTSGNEKVLYAFGSVYNDGVEPYAGLVDVNGTLYGTTLKGGAYYNGTVYSVTTTGTETVLHSFGNSGDGSSPYAGLLDVNGTLYGTTYGGGASGAGTVFSLIP